MAHEEKHVRSPRSPKRAPPNTAGTDPSDTESKKANPSARLTRLSRGDRDNTKPQPPAGSPGVDMRAAPGSSIDNEGFQSWITRVRVLNQNDAEHLDEPETGETGAEQSSGTGPASPATAQPTASTPPAKPVQSSRDWSQTAKKALDEMLVTLPDDQPAGWSAPYQRQTPVPPPPAKPALPLYAKALLPFMGLALAAYPLYFAAQKGWIPGLSGNDTSQLIVQKQQAGQTPAPLLAQPGRIQSTTQASRGGFKLATSKPARPAQTTSLVVSRPSALPAPIAPQTPVRATLLRPETAQIPATPTPVTPAKPVQPAGTQAPAAAAGWTTQISRQVSNANSASVPITVENVVAVGPTAAPALVAATTQRAAPPALAFASAAPAIEPNQGANNSLELPSKTLAVGGPVIALDASTKLPRRGGQAAKPPAIQQKPPQKPTQVAAIAPAAPVVQAAPAASEPRVQQRPSPAINSPRTTAVENTGALLERGNGLLKLGDVVSARLFFELAAKAGNPAGALAAGRTYDPLYLNRLGVFGIKADPAKALTWYRTARRAGNTASAADILRLESSAAR